MMSTDTADKNISAIQHFVNQLQSQVKKNLAPITYLDSRRKEDILKKVYRKSKLTEDINLEFHNGYKCEMNPEEFFNVVQTFALVATSYNQDLSQLYGDPTFVESQIKIETPKGN